MADLDALRLLSRVHGIQLRWHDIWGAEREVSEATLRALLGAMHVPADDDQQVHAALHAHHVELWRERVPPVVVARADAQPCGLPLRLPVTLDAQPLDLSLQPEDGAQQCWRFRPDALPELARAEVDGALHVARRLELPDTLAPGYYRYALRAGEQDLGRGMLVVAPASVYLPLALEGTGRVWGPAVQLYALRARRDWGIGDFTDLRLTLEQWAGRGAAVVGVSPLHALFAHDPARASPYSPSSRLFLNALFLDPEQIEDIHECEPTRDLLASAPFLARLDALRKPDLIDYPGVAQAKREVLEQLYASFRERHLAHVSGRAQAFRAFQQRGGEALERHALFEALQEHFHRLDPGVWGWPAWPEAYRDPNAAPVGEFARANRERVEFHQWLQWQADLQLEGIGLRSLELSLGVGLYGDLAVSVDRGGADAWAGQALYALSAGIGAPPDDFNLNGQDWGLPPWIPRRLRAAAYAPFIDTLRANMRHTGALRIDHVMGLMRLYWIPPGATPAQGAYVHYPLDDLIGILALESQRNRCAVIGEDLGTVPDAARDALGRAGVLSYRLLYFERRDDADFKAPAEYPAQALVAASTHDLPTLAGFWEGRDLELRARLKLFPSEEAHQQQVLARVQDRARLLAALQREGMLPDTMSLDPAATRTFTPQLGRSLHLYLARTPSKVLLIQLEDVLGAPDQVNLPGTTEQYPNWRRRLPIELERWPLLPEFGDLCAGLESERPRWVAPSPHGAHAAPSAARVPLATYRLQLNAGFGFRAAAGVVPYLAELGVSHVYCSPFLRARPGSAHGYDVIDHNSLNPEIGTREDFEAFVAALHAHGMGQILDVVPNHMGVMGADNAWWMDVLENGRASVYADYFDIDWEPINPRLRGKVLVPVLGDHYGIALERGEIRLRLEAERGSLAFVYFDHRFPLDPRDYAAVLEHAIRALPAQALDEAARIDLESLRSAFTHLPARDSAQAEQQVERNRDKEVLKRRLAVLCRDHPAITQALELAVQATNGTPGKPDSFNALHELLDAQAYRLAYWRVASDEINYRRFFDINDLAALRMERDTVFEATHRLILELLATGKADGVRIDHPDGLYDPAAYFRRLQDRVADLRGARLRPASGSRLAIYLVAEKITAGHEHVPRGWAVHGTTGYRFANVVNGLFVDTAARSRMDRIYRTFTGQQERFEDVVYACKRLVLRTSLASELNVLANQLARLAQADRRTRDYTLNNLRQALTAVIACFPVYRSYVAATVSAQDRRYMDWAVARAKRRSQASDIGIFDFVLSALHGQLSPALETAARVFTMKFQQLTAPVTAKGVEDTAFYRYNRLVSLNEVGGDPEHFGITLQAFHGASRNRAVHWPATMLATSTHDSKRGEDVRARINALSEMPAAWRLALRRWSRLNRSRKRTLDGGLAPSANDEYLLYQTLLGSWPAEPLDEAGLAAYRERIREYMSKAVREAKSHSSWINVNPEYEAAVAGFVDALLGRLDGNPFLDDLLPLQRTLAWIGILNSLSQTAVKLLSPGVPDIFQGTELWQFTLVDPDNRRPVDWELRRRLLAEIRPLVDEPAHARIPRLQPLLRSPEDGRCKLYLLCALLALRRRRADLFRHGDYAALAAGGDDARRLVAFARRHGRSGVIVLAPRLLAGLIGEPGRLPCGTQIWGDTAVPVPWLPDGTTLHDVLSGRSHCVGTQERQPTLRPAELLSAFPVCVLEYDDAHGAPG